MRKLALISEYASPRTLVAENDSGGQGLYVAQTALGLDRARIPSRGVSLPQRPVASRAELRRASI